MIKQLNDLTRHRTHGTLDLHLEPFDLVPLAQEAVQEAGASSPLHQMHLESDSPEIPIVADAERLQRVLTTSWATRSNTAPAVARLGSRWSGNMTRWSFRSPIPVLASQARTAAAFSTASSVAATWVQLGAVASD